jgi:hypothetical protein
MTSLLAACRKHSAATGGLHAGTKPVCLGATATPRLKCTLWQSIPLNGSYVSEAREISGASEPSSASQAAFGII